MGEDELGRRAEKALRANGLRLRGRGSAAPQRRALTVPGFPRRAHDHRARQLHPLGDDPSREPSWTRADGVYRGRPGGATPARRARVLVATARELPTLQLRRRSARRAVHSARDPAERYEPGDIHPAQRLVVSTEGSDGGRYVADGKEGRWAPAPLPGPLADTYGAGDSFAAGLTFALARGLAPQEAVELASGLPRPLRPTGLEPLGGDSSV